MNGNLRKVLQRLAGRKIYDRASFIWRKIRFGTRRDTNYCPCCNSYISGWKSFRKYDWSDLYNPEIFNEQRDKCLCPVCDSAPRHRIEAHWLGSQDFNYRKVLLWAPELSITTYFDNITKKYKEVSVVTADMYKENALRQENIECSSFNDNEFDLIICNHVLEHVSDVEKALKDLFRVLNNSGTLLLTVPIDFNNDITIDSVNKNMQAEEYRKKVFGQKDHLRLFGKDFEKLLIANGFKVSKYKGDELADKRILPVVGPSDYDSNVIFVCYKSH